MRENTRAHAACSHPRTLYGDCVKEWREQALRALRERYPESQCRAVAVNLDGKCRRRVTSVRVHVAFCEI